MAARFRSAILDEKKRSTVCAAVTILVAAPISYLWLRHEGAPAEHARAVGAVIVWTTFAVVEAGATFLAYRGLTRDQLIAVLKADTGAATDVESPRAEQQQSESVSAETGPGAIVQAFAGRLSRSIEQGRRYWRRSTHDSYQVPSWSVHVSILALLVVGGILVTPALRGSQSVLFVALAMVIGSWVNVLVSYGVHYARLDIRTRVFSFPGGQLREFVDYLYLALAVQTAFGTNDVSVTSVAGRRAVMGHSALAFLFNSVLIAMIVSLMLGSAYG